MAIRLTGQGRGMPAKPPVLAVAAAATLVAVGLLALRGNGSDSPVVEATGASPSGSDGTLVSVGHPSTNGPRPAEIAAISGGAVVMLDGRDGRTLRRLATHPEATTGGFPYLQGVSLSPDASEVFYSLVGDCDAATIFRVAANGSGAAVPMLTGVSPAVSPDGTKLAYAVAVAGRAPDERQCQNAIVVRDLASGADRTWRYPATPDYAAPLYQDAVITEIDWAPDSTRLAYTLSYEGDSVAVLDTEADTDLGQTLELVVPDGGGNSSHPAWQAGSGLLGVFNTRFECCFDDNYSGPPRALLVDPDRRLPTPLLPAGRRVTALDFDASGANLAFIDGGRLYLRNGDQAPVGLVTGVTAIDW